MKSTLDARLEGGCNYVALAVLAVLAALSVHYAGSTIFNPDEAEKVLAALAPTWQAALESSRSVSHPPLVVMLVHAQSLLGTAELWLRLPGLLATLVAGWFLFRWLRLVAGAAAAVAGLVFFVSSPMTLSAATEVREYGLLLAFTTAALLSAEHMLRRGSYRWLVLHGLALASAFLDHYSAAWVAVVVESYVLLELRRRGARPGFWLAWSLMQCVLVGVAAWTFFVHGTVFTSKVGVGTTDLFWVAHGFPQAESWWRFTATHLYNLFAYFAGGWVAGWLAIALYVVGVVAVVRTAVRPIVRREVAVLVVAPLLLGIGLGLARLYPFNGMRQVTYLLPFVSAGVGVGAAAVVGRRLTPMVVLAFVVTPIALWLAVPEHNPAWTARRHLEATLAALDEVVTPRRSLFVSDAAGWQLRYYWRGKEQLQRMRYLEPRSWGLHAPDVLRQARTSAAAANLYGPTELCILASGLSRGVPEPLHTHVPPDQLIAHHENGFLRLVCLRLKAGWRRLLQSEPGQG